MRSGVRVPVTTTCSVLESSARATVVAKHDAATTTTASARTYFGTSKFVFTDCGEPFQGFVFERWNKPFTQSPVGVPAYGASIATDATVPSGLKVTVAVPGPETPPSFLQNATAAPASV